MAVCEPILTKLRHGRQIFVQNSCKEFKESRTNILALDNRSQTDRLTDGRLGGRQQRSMDEQRDGGREKEDGPRLSSYTALFLFVQTPKMFLIVYCFLRQC